MLREILEFVIGPDDKHLLYLWARRLCKKSIVLIEHPNFAQLRLLLTPKQSLTHVYVYSQSDVDNIRNSLHILEAYRLKLHVAENLLFPLIQVVQDASNGASRVYVVELELLPGQSDISTAHIEGVLAETRH